MSLIEGIGDEVTVVVGGFLVCIILMLAWLSTHTADIPLLREVGVIVVELRQRRSRTQNPVNEERSERDDSGGSAEEERQIYDIDHQASETSNAQIRAEVTSENISSVERIHTSLSPSSNESVDLPDVSAPQDLLPGLAEATTSNVDQTLMTASPQGRRKSEDQVLSNNLSETETNIPKASVVVDDNIGFAFPNEEEIRQRRVQYFQTNKPAQTLVGENTAFSDPEDNRPSSLSETLAYDSDTTRQFKDTLHPSNPPLSDQNQRAEAAQESVALNSKTASHPPSVAVEDLDNSVSSSLQEDISDIQASSILGESSHSSKIRVKLKYMNETQRLVYAKPLDTIGEFRRTHFQAELQDNKWVRFIYNGQDLRDDSRTLQACSIGDNCTMHCLITAPAQPQSARDAAPEEDDDSFMGTMMYPLFTVIILIVWYFRFTYRQYFSAMSTICLIGISFLLALSYISSLRSADRTPPQQRVGTSSATTAAGGGVREEHQHAD